MENHEIAAVLRRIADLMELKDENPFKVRSYRLAADTLDEYHDPIAAIAAEGATKLQTIPGIGKSISGAIVELVETGSCETYERIKTEVPESTLELLNINGIGPKTLQKLFRDFQITGIDQLEAFALAGKLETMAGFTKKSVDKILRSIALLKERRGLMLLSDACELFERLEPELRKIVGIEDVLLTGGARRAAELVERVEIMLVVAADSSVGEALKTLPGIKTIEAFTETRIDLVCYPNLRVSFELATAAERVVAMVRSSSTSDHFESLKDLAAQQSFRLTEQALYNKRQQHSANERHSEHSEHSEHSDRLTLADEAALYHKLGLPLIAYEQRELPIDQLELSAQATLIDSADLRGDLHLHTIASDGANTIREMAAAARAIGLQYIAITDHSRSSTIANGLDEKRLLAQLGEIDELNREFADDADADGFRILKGCEVDILSDGYLDHSDEILAQLDFVVASVHSGFAQPRARVTKRILKAFESGRVNVFAHPTGRLLGRRPGYEVDLAVIFEAARACQVFLELNSNPHRLDLSAEHLAEAKAAGVKFIISTDSHSIRGFRDRRYGIATARRAGLTAADVINTLSLNEFLLKLSPGGQNLTAKTG